MIEKEDTTNDKYIILYSDEFLIDIWESYMKILDLPFNTKEVKLLLKDIIKLS